jgi:sec-independent protein translocase protein TatC
VLASRPPAVGGTDDVEWDQKEMPFTEHLRELRQRLIVCVSTILGIAVLALWPAQQLIPMITRTYFHGIKLNAFGPADAVWAIFKFAIYIAIILGLPVLLYQTWMFVVPAIHPKTRKAVYRYVSPSIFLAAAGIAFAHYVVLPRVIGALLNITDSIAEPVFGIESTISLVLLIFLAFALIFQTPVIMILLARIGLINVAFLRTNRKYIWFGMMVVGAVLAPDGSPLTMTMLAAPMMVLFEASIWIIVVLEKSWKRDALTAGS